MVLDVFFFFFFFDSSPIRLHGEGGVYDLYCSQPPGGDQNPRSDCQPKSDFVHIWIESDLNNWLSTQHIATVQIWFVCQALFRFYWMCIGFYGNAIACCYAYAKNNSNSNKVCNTDVALPSRLCCCIIFRLVRQRQKCRKLVIVALFRAADLRYFAFFLSPLLSKHKEVRILAVYWFIPLYLTGIKLAWRWTFDIRIFRDRL